MVKSKRDLIISAAVILVAVLLYYGQSALSSPASRVEKPEPVSAEADAALLRKLDSTVTYKVPGGEHEVVFSVLVDDKGVVGDTSAVDTLDPSNKASLDKFSGELIKVIKGKKLNEIGQVDKVGSSSIITNAFNEALPEIKSQL